MLTKNSNHERLITELCEYIQQKHPGDQEKLFTEFVRQYYRSVATEELESRSISDLYGGALSMWNLLQQRKPGETKINIYNPHFEEHGWQSTHTVIEVVHDDMPFLVDSIRMEIDRLGLGTHLMIHVGGMKLRRDANDQIIEVMPYDAPVGKGTFAEAPIYLEIDRQTDPKVLARITKNLKRVLHDVRAAVEDWGNMKHKLQQAIEEIKHATLELEAHEVDETLDFLRWLGSNNFTFLGYRCYDVVREADDFALKIVPDSGLGVLKDTSVSKVYRSFAEFTPEARKQALSKHILIISKTNTRSTVHRHTYTDSVIIKIFDNDSKIIGEHWFIGLYTSSAYNDKVQNIPFIREKIVKILQNSGLSSTGHAGKALLHILETLPRDDLFQATTLELTDLAMGILHLQERKRIRMFARMDVYHRFISVLVYVPRNRFDTELGYAMQEVLKKAFNAIDINFTTWFSESVLARIHYVVRIDASEPLKYDLKAIEKKLIEVGRSWKEDLYQNLLDYFGEEKGNTFYQNYSNGFPAGYRETFPPRTAVYDIEHIETLSEERPLSMSFYRPLEEPSGSLRFKLFRPDTTIPLSDALPIFENMGLRVIGERPYEITYKNGRQFWINDFNMQYSPEVALEVSAIKRVFQEAFFHVWNGDAENDRFNNLVLSARLGWREVTIIRAYTKYLRQTDFTYSHSYIEQCITNYPDIAGMLVDLFMLRFDPHTKDPEAAIEKLEARIEKSFDKVVLLDEDKILRGVYSIIKATLRTNYFQSDEKGNPKPYLSLKLDPNSIPNMPLPVPKFEIFVYSPRFEAVHLRTSKVARGGLRWSDRREDFRTEILGLMKAQNVKNAVIVPTGAKGGFVPKLLPSEGTREEIMEEVINCYKSFIRGMLDITDNLVSGQIVPPKNVIRYDDDDSYLVVAADKGTATFSDIANGIANEYNFWLNDAFASGGSAGYDHKKMGITARGGWESVKRHFRELDLDIQTQDFTVVGIGDMAGDVFGNGMLLSRHIRLVAAFNHQHIFLDPDPNPETSYQERERLFNLPRSSWEDYNPDLISEGGGVFRRTAKAIKLTEPMKALLNIKKDFIVPNDLIKAIMLAKVDLLWNGGIGTYVKAESESNNDVGDRANDGLRINGSELHARVVGEGGNLGFTQLGRVEYELNGGQIYTDFIDNSGGVDCSDHEVNVKILLNGIMSNGDMTEKQRLQLLADMTDEVAHLVLRNNYHQTLALSLAAYQSAANNDLHKRYINELVKNGEINRALEFLPDDETINERKTLGRGLTRPELAILFAYCKSLIQTSILDSDLPEDPLLGRTVRYAFPKSIRERFHSEMQQHSLRREIIATIVSNTLVNEMGFTFIYQLQTETGAHVDAIIRSYAIARQIFQLENLWRRIEDLDYKIKTELQLEMTAIITRLIRRATRWLLRNRRLELDAASIQKQFTEKISLLNSHLSNLLVGQDKDNYQEIYQRFVDADIPEDLANVIAGTRAMLSALDIIDAANFHNLPLFEVASIYFQLSERLELSWMRDQINAQPVDNQWDALAKEACRDDLDWQQRSLTIAAFEAGRELPDTEEKIAAWLQTHSAFVDRWSVLLASLKASPSLTFIMFSVAVRELMDLAQSNSINIKTRQKKSAKKNGRQSETKNSDEVKADDNDKNTIISKNDAA